MRTGARRAWLCMLLLVCNLKAQGQVQVLDDFSSTDAWRTNASDQVTAVLRQESSPESKWLCLDYNFNGVAGYAVARRALPLEFPENYQFEVELRGQGGPNHLELKWVDSSGDNVWWATRRNWQPADQEESWRIKKRHIDFAWGPTTDKQLRASSHLELVVSSGTAGGQGRVCLAQLRWRSLPGAVAPASEPVLHARKHGADAHGEWLIDFGNIREFGAVALNWAPGRASRRYDIDASEDGVRWETRWRPTRAAGDVHEWFLPETEARYLRLRMWDGSTHDHPLGGVHLRDVSAGSSRNAFIQAVAQTLPSGSLPRAFSGQQSYWTLLGTADGGNSGLLGEDGAIELGRGGPSLEPFLWLESGARIAWAQVSARHTLKDGYLPIPTVHWRTGDVSLKVTATAVAEGTSKAIIGRYTVHNHARKRQRLRLVLALRPWQVNPPAQFLNTPGGVSPVHQMGWDGRMLQTDTMAQVWPLSPPEQVVLWPAEAGLALPERSVCSDHCLRPQAVQDEQGLAQGALVYSWVVPAGASRHLDLVLPLSGAVRLPANMAGARRWTKRQLAQAAQQWRSRLNPLQWQVPPSGQPMIDSLRSALAHMLMSRDGAALQPGTRSYARSWIRDGAMMVEGLLRLGHDQVAQDFVNWFAPHQFASGKVPCCVDRRGADPVPENDSHGQLIFAVAQLYRYTQDAGQLRRVWPHVERALEYMEGLRQSERSAQNLVGERRAFWGLMPASISHEGYSAKPMHSYWDNFWALRGYKDAVYVATQLGYQAQATRWQRALSEFELDLQHSLILTAQHHGLDYLAGSAELGDFDATSTTVALSPAQAQTDERLLTATFERYWREFVRRRDVDLHWEDYTPYELRTVGSFVRLGRPDRAQELLQFFLSDQRPSGWNQWAEVVGRDTRKSRFVGDMPHAWISSDYVRALLDLFAYEREADGAMVLAAGVPTSWLQGRGLGLTGLRTSFGALSFRLQLSASGLSIRTDARKRPPGGWLFRWPGPSKPPAQVRVNGKAMRWDANELRW